MRQGTDLLNTTGESITICSIDSPSHACGYLRSFFPFGRLFPQATKTNCFSLNKESAHCGEIIDANSVDLSLFSQSKLIFMQRQFPQFSTIDALETILAAECPVIYDIDDLLTEMPAWHCHRKYVEKNRAIIIETMKHVDAVTVSTESLGEECRRITKNVYHLPNLIDEKLWYAKRYVSAEDPVCIGVGGTPTHLSDLLLIEKPLEKVACEFGKHVRFVFLGCATERLMKLPNSSFIPFKASYHEYVKTVHDALIDIALVPLCINRFNRCKSNVKWLEYTLSGAAGIYSDIRPYRECIRNGETGLLASGVAQWHAALRRLIMNSMERTSIVNSSREAVLRGYSWKAAGWRYQEFYSAITKKPIKIRSKMSRKRMASGMIVSGRRLVKYPDEAMRCFQQAAILNPDNIESYCEAAELCMNYDVWEQAELLLEKAIELRPRYGRAYRLLARVLENCCRMEEVKICNELAESVESLGT